MHALDPIVRVDVSWIRKIIKDVQRAVARHSKYCSFAISKPREKPRTAELRCAIEIAVNSTHEAGWTRAVISVKRINGFYCASRRQSKNRAPPPLSSRGCRSIEGAVASPYYFPGRAFPVLSVKRPGPNEFAVGRHFEDGPR